MCVRPAGGLACCFRDDSLARVQGVIPTQQPGPATFARVYAVYGGCFIVMSYLCVCTLQPACGYPANRTSLPHLHVHRWGWAVDGDR